MKPSRLFWASLLWGMWQFIVYSSATHSPTANCASLSSSSSCAKYGAATGCLWYSGIQLCRLAPYCHSAWDLATCENLYNKGSCVYQDGACNYRTTFAATINAGKDCKIPCNPPGASYVENYQYNEHCNFCGSEGFCCKRDNPHGCLPQGCTTELCCAEPKTGSPTLATLVPSPAPSMSPITSAPSESPSGAPSKSPQVVPAAPTTLQPTQSPVTHSPTRQPSSAPSSSSPGIGPLRTPSTSPTLHPSVSPTTPAPSTSPTVSSPTSSPSLPTSSPSRAPTNASALHPDDQLAWKLFRTSFDDRSYCGNTEIVACEACEDLTSENRHIVCKEVTMGSPTNGAGRTLQQTELRIVEIVLRNSNLRGELPVDVLSSSLPYLRVLDLTNDEEVPDKNELHYDTGCIPLQPCIDGFTDCRLPPELPPLCDSTTAASVAGFPVYGYVGIGVAALVLLLIYCCSYLYCAWARKKRARARRKSSMKSRKSAASQASHTSIMSHESGARAIGPRKVSFTKNPALVYTPNPNVSGGKKRRRSSTTKKLKRQWEEEWDPATNRPFWVNHRTGEFTWVAPGEKPEEERILPPPSFPNDLDDDDDETIQRFPIVVDGEPDGSGSTSRRSSRKSGVDMQQFDPEVWEMVYDEVTQSRFMVNSMTGEFVTVPEGETFVTGSGDDTDTEEHDPLWKPEIDFDTGDLYWIDVESGLVEFTMPTTGIIVSSDMLEATGRYTREQVYMKKPPHIKRPADLPSNASASPERRRSSGLRALMLPRKSSGIDSLDLGSRRTSGTGSFEAKGSWSRNNQLRSSTHSGVHGDEQYIISSYASQIDGEYDDDEHYDEDEGEEDDEEDDQEEEDDENDEYDDE